MGELRARIGRLAAWTPAAQVDARERVLTEVLLYGRAWKLPVAEAAAAGQQIRDQAVADVSRWRAEAEAGDLEAVAPLAYWQTIRQASARVAGRAGRSPQRSQRA